MRKDRLRRMERPWFAGGTITIASVQGDGHHLHQDEAGFEDGTVDYLNLPAVTTGLQHLEEIDRDATHTRVGCLTEWLLEALAGLSHADGRPLVQVLGPSDTVARGGTVTFVMHDRDGVAIDDRRVEELANDMDISLRTGCFCNPGAGEIAHGLGPAEMRRWFERDEPVPFNELRDHLRTEHHVLVAAIRVSVGVATTFGDVYRLLGFLHSFLDRTVEEIGHLELQSDHCRVVRDSA
jgi:molybdenum cofactor sulfurtransferase